jgi:eukaryotic-like serine/threonine-protein kinase
MLFANRIGSRVSGLEALSEQAGRDPKRPFFGRERELAELQSGLTDAISGRGRFFVVNGEPGIGKSRLCSELASHATKTGAHVFWGRCWEAGGAPAYWPWIQILRAALRSQDSPAVESRIGLGAASIAELVPELANRMPGSTPDGGAEYEHARFYLFDAVTTFLKSLTERRAVVLLLDDLHAADEASLQLLRFVAHDLGATRLLVVGACRDGEVRERPRIADVFRALTRLCNRIPLAGLSEADVKSFIEHTLEAAVSPTLVSDVHRATEGNPFYVDEIVRLLAAGNGMGRPAGEALRIPDGVHETVRHRFRALSPEVRRTLEVASVAGRDFHVVIVAQVMEVAVEEVSHRLGEAVGAGAVAADASVAGRYGFVHALVRETFYADLPRARRYDLHRRFAKALERIHAANVDPHLAVIAHHFFLAAAGGEPRPAVGYARRAGERAMRLLAFEEAVVQFRHALEALALEAKPGGVEHCELLLALGEAHRKTGNGADARRCHAQAADMARAHGAPQFFARAALGYGGGVGGMGYVDGVDEQHVALLEEAIDGLGPDDDVLRARCLARLAAELYYTDFVERRRALSDQAVAMAQRLRDPGARVAALHSRHWSLWGPDSDPREQLHAAREIIDLAARIPDPEMRFRGHQLCMSAELVIGNVAAVDREIDSCAALAVELRQPVYLWQVAVFRAMRALLAGQVERAEGLAQQALALGQRGHEEAAQSFFAAQMANLFWMQGRLAAIEPLVVSVVGKEPRIAAGRAGLAFLYGELGRTALARAEFDLLARDDFASVPRDGTWIDAMYILSLVCVFLDDDRRAAALYELLRPYAERNATVSGGVVCFGPVSLALGALAATMKRWDDAERWLAAAADRATVMGARPYRVLAWIHQAAWRARRDAGTDVDDARELVQRALAEAAELAADGLADKARLLLESLAPAEPAPGSTADGTSGADTFHLDGDVWVIEYEARGFRLRDAKGLRYLARLLANPREKFHVSDLTDGNGAHREHDDPRSGERLRKAVANSIRHAIGRIDKQSPALALHLTNAVRTGAFCSYVPDHLPRWKL